MKKNCKPKRDHWLAISLKSLCIFVLAGVTSRNTRPAVAPAAKLTKSTASAAASTQEIKQLNEQVHVQYEEHNRAKIQEKISRG